MMHMPHISWRCSLTKTKSYRWHSWITPWLFIFPTLIGLIIFRLIPIVSSLYLGFTEWNLLRDPVFIGLENFKELFADPDFYLIISNENLENLSYQDNVENKKENKEEKKAAKPFILPMRG